MQTAVENIYLVTFINLTWQVGKAIMYSVFYPNSPEDDEFDKIVRHLQKVHGNKIKCNDEKAQDEFWDEIHGMFPCKLDRFDMNIAWLYLRAKFYQDFFDFGHNQSIIKISDMKKLIYLMQCFSQKDPISMNTENLNEVKLLMISKTQDEAVSSLYMPRLTWKEICLLFSLAAWTCYHVYKLELVATDKEQLKLFQLLYSYCTFALLQKPLPLYMSARELKSFCAEIDTHKDINILTRRLLTCARLFVHSITETRTVSDEQVQHAETNG